MKKIAPVILLLLLTLTACGPAPSPAQETDDGSAVLLATTYPVYLFTTAVTEGVEGCRVELMIDQPVSCLHDYTLSVNDMRTLESADVIVMNGAGLEAAMSDALDSVQDTPVIDCSQGIDLLEAEDGHEEGEDHGDGDPHIWMDPSLAALMIENIAEGLSKVDPDNAAAFSANAQAAGEALAAAQETLRAELSDLSCRELITFHDGFRYFARAFDLSILRSIEEEAGSEASAKEVGEIIRAVEDHSLPAVFTEVNGSTSTAEAIARETGCGVAALDLIMGRGHGEQGGIDPYLARLTDNVNAIREAYS